MPARPWFGVTNEVLEDELIDSGKKRTSACFCSVSVSVVISPSFNKADSLARPSTWAQKKRPGTLPDLCSVFSVWEAQHGVHFTPVFIGLSELRVFNASFNATF